MNEHFASVKFVFFIFFFFFVLFVLFSYKYEIYFSSRHKLKRNGYCFQIAKEI
jgi:hypothetical protein